MIFVGNLYLNVMCLGKYLDNCFYEHYLLNSDKIISLKGVILHLHVVDLFFL